MTVKTVPTGLDADDRSEELGISRIWPDRGAIFLVWLLGCTRDDKISPYRGFGSGKSGRLDATVHRGRNTASFTDGPVLEEELQGFGVA